MSNEGYTIYYFGDERSVSHAAAEAAKKEVVKYLDKADGVQVHENEIVIKGESDRKLLEALIDFNDPRKFFVVPLVNNVVGDVIDFMSFRANHHVEDVTCRVEFVLCNQSGNADDIKAIITKNTAFQQAMPDLRKRGYNVDSIAQCNGDPTSKNAELAQKDFNVATICTRDACNTYGLKPIGEVLGPYWTTFGIFVNEVVFGEGKAVLNLPGKLKPYCATLLQNATLYSGIVRGGGKLDFYDTLINKKTLRVKWGIDPLSDSLHLGHVACLYKLKQFVEQDHQVFIVLGTFTGQIGDPSCHLTSRPRYTPVDLQTNADALKKQIATILGEGKVTFVENSTLFKQMDLERLVKWGFEIDHNILVSRTDFAKRLDQKLPLSLSELLYGLFQAYDTLILKADIEIGGIDQMHNVSLMRKVFHLEGHIPPIALLIPSLPGIDGSAKMSGYESNEIRIKVPKQVIRNKLLSIHDINQVRTYLELLTDMPAGKIQDLLRAVNNKDILREEYIEMMVKEVLSKLDPVLDTSS